MHTYGAAALISEIDLNILFTLSLGLIAIWLTDTLLQRRQYLLAIISIITACLLATGLYTVSYTHLDVYKRQMCD